MALRLGRGRAARSRSSTPRPTAACAASSRSRCGSTTRRSRRSRSTTRAIATASGCPRPRRRPATTGCASCSPRRRRRRTRIRRASTAAARGRLLRARHRPGRRTPRSRTCWRATRRGRSRRREEKAIPSLTLVGPSDRCASRCGCRRRPSCASRPSCCRPRAPRAGAASFRVLLEDEAGGERELWSRVIDGAATPAGEQQVRLPGTTGDIVRLATGRGPGRPAALRLGPARGAAGPRLAGRRTRSSRSRSRPSDDARADAAAQEPRRRERAVRDPRRRPRPLVSAPTATPRDDDARDRRAGAPRASSSSASTLPPSTRSARCRRSGPRSTRPPPQRGLLLGAAAEGPPDARRAALGAGRPHGRLRGQRRGRQPSSASTAASPSSRRSSATLGSRGDVFRQVVPDWLKQNRDRRFFAYVHFREPHFPYDPEPPFDTRFGPDGPIPKAARRDSRLVHGREPGPAGVQRGGARAPRAPLRRQPRLRRPGGGCAACRRSRARGCSGQTVVIVAADHGEELLEHGWIGHNVQVYEPSVHMPLIVRFPKGTGPAGQRVTALSGPARRGAHDRRHLRRARQGRLRPRVPGPQPAARAAGAPGKPAVLSRTRLGPPALRAARRALQVPLRHPHGRGAALRPHGRSRARRATWPTRCRCAPPTTARRSTPGRCVSRAADRAAAPRPS